MPILDGARALSAISVRVVEIIPAQVHHGSRFPNEAREIVTLGEIIKSKAYDELASPLALMLGKDIGGAPVVADLTACRTCWSAARPGPANRRR